MIKTEYMPVECLLVPKVLFQDTRYKSLSTTAKLLYSLLLGRKEFSAQNGWLDSYDRRYVIYPKREMRKDLNCSRYRVDEAISELEQMGNMVRIVKENGRPNRFYINDISRETREEKRMMTMNDVMKQMEPADREKLMEQMAVKAHEIMEELMKMGYIGTCACGHGKSPADHVSADQMWEDDEDMDFDEYDLEMADPMELRGYVDEDGKLNIDAIQADACDFALDLVVALAEISDGSPEFMDKMQQHLNLLYQYPSKNVIMAAIETIAYLCGNSQKLIDDMLVCEGKVKKVYLKELIEMFNGFMEAFHNGELIY